MKTEEKELTTAERFDNLISMIEEEQVEINKRIEELKETFANYLDKISFNQHKALEDFFNDVHEETFEDIDDKIEFYMNRNNNKDLN